MKTKQHITFCNYMHLHPVRDVSLGRININHTILHPVRDASLTGCRGITTFSFFYQAMHSYGKLSFTYSHIYSFTIKLKYSLTKYIQNETS